MNNIIQYWRTTLGLNENARLFLVHTILSGLSLAILSLLYNLYIQSLGFKQDMIGTVTLVACTVTVVAALPGSFLLHRLGYRRAFVLGIAIAAVSFTVPLVFPVGAAFIVSEILWGTGFTLVVIAGGPFMTENSTNENRTHLFSLQFVLTTLTAFVGNLLGGEMPHWFGNWMHVGGESPEAYQGALWVAAVLMLVSAIPFFFIHQRMTAGDVHVARPRLTIRNRKATAKLLAPYIIAALGAGMIVPFANVLFKSMYGLSDATIGTIFAVSALAMAGLGLMTPMMSKRMGEVPLMVLAQGLAVVALVGFGFSPWLGVAVAGYIARDGLSNMLRPLYAQFMMEESDPAERAAVSSIATMGYSFAWGVSSWLSGEWQTDNHLDRVFLVAIGFAVLSTAVMVWFFMKGEKPEMRGLALPVGSPAE